MVGGVRNWKIAVGTRAVLAAAGMLLAIWAVIAATGWASCLGWLAELLANFPLAPILAGTIATALLLRFGNRLTGVLGAAALAIALGTTLVPKPEFSSGDAKRGTLKFATWNAYLGQLDPTAVLHWVESSQPDVIAFTEITQRLHGNLEKPLRKFFPYALGNPRNGPGGLAVFSKVPLMNWKRNAPTARYASCDFQWPGGPICKLIVAHPPAPTRGAWYRARADVLREIAMEAVDEHRPLIVMGDFNSTWAARDFREFCHVTKLRPASNFLPTWHAALPWMLRVPIDHVLARPDDFYAISAGVGTEGAGSDHLPVLAEIALRWPVGATVR